MSRTGGAVQAFPAPHGRHAGSGQSSRHWGVSKGAHVAHAQAASHARRAGAHNPMAVLRTTHQATPARLASQLVELGVIVSYDGTSMRATVRLAGSQSNVIGPVPVNLALAGVSGLVGASCLVILPDAAAALDGVVVAAFR